MLSDAHPIQDGRMSMRIAKAVLVLGSPVYLLVLGPFGILGVPVITLLLGGSVWPGLSRGRLALLGTVTVVTEAAVYAIAVFAFYGLGGPTGAWFWAGPAVGLAVYITGCWFAVQRPWTWPVSVTAALLAIAAIGAFAMVTGVPFES